MDLYSLRKKLGLTQVEMAKRIGVTYVTVNRWENGHHAPSPLAWHYIEKLEKTLESPDVSPPLPPPSAPTQPS